MADFCKLIITFASPDFHVFITFISHSKSLHTT